MNCFDLFDLSWLEREEHVDRRFAPMTLEDVALKGGELLAVGEQVRTGKGPIEHVERDFLFGHEGNFRGHSTHIGGAQ